MKYNMKKMKKFSSFFSFLRIAVVFSLCIAVCLIACGCESGINFYNYPGENGATYVLEFLLKDDEVSVLNNSAKGNEAVRHNGYLKKSGSLAGINANAGDPWTIEQYIRAVMEIGCPEFAFNETQSGNKETSMIFLCQVLYGGNSEADSDEEDGGNSTEIRRGFFFYTIHVEQDSIVNAYKDAYYNGGDGVIGSKAVDIVNNGYKEIRSVSSENYEAQRAQLIADGFTEISEGLFEIEVVPPLNSAFPIVKDVATYFPDKLTVNYVLQSDNKMVTSGETVYDEFGNRYYLFSTKFDEKDDKIEFNYIRANSIGWNVLAILIGLLTVGGLMLYCKFHKQKEPKKSAYAAARERFPYDPYEKIDPFEEYNVTKKDDGNNPFEGY